jgi:hypothetical protein
MIDLYQNRIDNSGVLLCQNHLMIHPIYQILSNSKVPMLRSLHQPPDTRIIRIEES